MVVHRATVPKRRLGGTSGFHVAPDGWLTRARRNDGSGSARTPPITPAVPRAYEELLVVGLDIPRDGEARLADALRRRFATATGRG